MVAVLMYVAGCLWLLFGALAVGGGAFGNRGSDMDRLIAIELLSFGIMFIGIGGLIQALKKRAT